MMCDQGSMDAGNSAARADSGSAGAAGKPEESQALTEEALHLKRIHVWRLLASNNLLSFCNDAGQVWRRQHWR